MDSQGGGGEDGINLKKKQKNIGFPSAIREQTNQLKKNSLESIPKVIKSTKNKGGKNGKMRTKEQTSNNSQ